MFYQNQNLITHSGLVVDAHAESAQVYREQMTFSYWFWYGGFVAFIFYTLIAMGTGVFIKYIFSILKKA